jgi:sulfur-carrier protein
MSNSLISITVKLFAAYQEAYGVPELKLEFPTGTPVKAVCEHVIGERPQLAKWQDVTRYGINLLFVEPDTPLKNGDEVVLVPPVSGG